MLISLYYRPRHFLRLNLNYHSLWWQTLPPLPGKPGWQGARGTAAWNRCSLFCRRRILPLGNCCFSFSLYQSSWCRMCGPSRTDEESTAAAAVACMRTPRNPFMKWAFAKYIRVYYSLSLPNCCLLQIKQANTAVPERKKKVIKGY